LLAAFIATDITPHRASIGEFIGSKLSETLFIAMKYHASPLICQGSRYTLTSTAIAAGDQRNSITQV
jgi:hypothetical protein